MTGASITTRVNGAADAAVSVLDRGLLFGDGVFETIVVQDGRPRFWQRHMTRLQTGCHRLGIRPVDLAGLHAEAEALLSSGQHGILKVIITRGAGGRGYGIAADAEPTCIVQLHPWPEGLPAAAVRLMVCDLRLGVNPALAGIKHLNRLEQVLARQECDAAGSFEGLLLDQDDRVIEGTMSNIFLVRDRQLLTPDLQRCGVAGVMRSIVLDIADQAGIACVIRDIDKAALLQADEVFICNSLLGIVAVEAIDGSRYQPGQLTGRLQTLLAQYTDDNPRWHR